MSIRRKLTILMLFLSLVPTLIVGVLAYISINSELTSKTVDQLNSTASKQEQKINALIQNKREEVSKLTNRFDLQTALSNYINTNGQWGGDDIYSILFNRKVANSDLQSITLVNLEGKVVATTTSGNSVTHLDPKEYSIADNKEGSLTVEKGQQDGIAKIRVVSRVSVNKKPAGYLSVMFRADDIIAAVQDYTGLGSTGETIVAAQDSNGAVALFPLRFDTDAALSRNLNSLSLFDKTNGVYKDAIDYRDKQVMISTKTLASTDWKLATKIDMDEALASIVQLRNTIALVVIASSVVIAGIILYVTRLFTRPILQIAQASQKIGYGNFSTRVSVKNHDEIGELAGSINAMGANLSVLVSNIESQRHRLEAILNSTTDSILAIDKNGLIVLANNAGTKLTGYSEETLAGRHIDEVFKFTRDLQPYSINYDVTGVNTYPGLQYQNADGTTHYVKVIVAKITEVSEQSAAQVIVTIHDETKSRELENMKLDFVSMAAHELRTPLAAIRGYLELMTYKNGSAVSDGAADYLQQALRSASELGGLISNLLSVSRIERGALTFNPQKLDLGQEIKQAIEDVSVDESGKSNNVSVKFEGLDQGCFVQADQLALHEVLNNLINNAIKYNKKDGQVIITLSQNGDNYRVSIKDSGIGIPRQALGNLFTKFYRVRGGLNSGSTGTGLGLFIAKSIIERHKGSIYASSQEGVGSEFTFELPMFDKCLAEDSNQQARRERGWTTQNIAR